MMIPTRQSSLAGCPHQSPSTHCAREFSAARAQSGKRACLSTGLISRLLLLTATGRLALFLSLSPSLSLSLSLSLCLSLCVILTVCQSLRRLRTDHQRENPCGKGLRLCGVPKTLSGAAGHPGPPGQIHRSVLPLHSTLYPSHFLLHTPSFALHSILHTPLHPSHSILRTPLHPSHSTPSFSLHPPHSILLCLWTAWHERARLCVVCVRIRACCVDALSTRFVTFFHLSSLSLSLSLSLLSLPTCTLVRGILGGVPVRLSFGKSASKRAQSSQLPVFPMGLDPYSAYSGWALAAHVYLSIDRCACLCLICLCAFLCLIPFRVVRCAVLL